MKTERFLIILGICLVIILAIILWMGWKGYQLQKRDLSIVTDKTEYESGGILKVKIKNNFGENICFSSCYPYLLENKNENWESYKYAECQKFNGNGSCIEARKEKAFELTLPEAPEGLHRLAIPVCLGCKSEDSFQEDQRFYSNEFWIREKKKEVTITTDKTEYEQGDIVKITVKNNIDKNVCFESCNAYYLEKKNGKWEIDQKSMKLCGIENFIGECLESGETKTFELKTALDSYYKKDPGTYRAVVHLCIDCQGLKDFRTDKTIYSNEFTIKTTAWKTYKSPDQKKELIIRGSYLNWRFFIREDQEEREIPRFYVVAPYNIQWSPDSKKFAFTDAEVSNEHNAYVVDINTGKKIRLEGAKQFLENLAGTGTYTHIYTKNISWYDEKSLFVEVSGWPDDSPFRPEPQYFLVNSDTGKVIKQVSEEKVETANWKTYASTNLGVSFKYPDGTKIIEENDFIQINNWEIKVYKNENKKPLKEWFESVFDRARNSQCEFMESNIKVGDYQANLISTGSAEEACDNGGYYAISHTNSSVVKVILGHDPLGDFSQILSTFRFLE